MRYQPLSLGAQTAYAELFDQVQSQELHNSLANLTGAFHKRKIKTREYWYFGYRDISGEGRMVYVGPDGERVRSLIERFKAGQENRITPQANAAIALGCEGTLPKHFKVIKQLSEYGLFRAGGVLIGTHAFVAYGNLLGAKWADANRTLDIDFAHSGKSISLALPADIKIDIRSAIESLEMGLLPISQFNGKTGAQYRNPKDPELRLDFVTVEHRGNPASVEIPGLNLTLEPLKFMEFSLEDVIQGCVFSKTGGVIVNLPSPARYTVHKLIVYGERPIKERTKSTKDLLQVAALGSYFLESGNQAEFTAAWEDGMSRGKGWASRMLKGWEALVKLAPELAALRE